MNMEISGERGGQWTLLTGHGHVLVEIARNPTARIRDISPIVGLTERTVQVIVADLEAAGYLTRTRAGRRTRCIVAPTARSATPPRKDFGSARSSTRSPRRPTPTHPDAETGKASCPTFGREQASAQTKEQSPSTSRRATACRAIAAQLWQRFSMKQNAR
jgi:hypothetical protein